MKLFHVSQINHQIGAVLQPGHFGAQVRSAIAHVTSVDVGFMRTLAWEGPLEVARRLSHPTAPSRLNCLFATKTLSEAQTFRQRYRPGGAVFEIDVPDHCSRHEADFEAITIMSAGTPMVDGFVSGTFAYWSPKAGVTSLLEILVDGPATIAAKMP